jgi:hypothetical protein
MLTLFWDMEDAIFGSFQSKGSRSRPPALSMFGPVKEALRGRRFSSYEDVIGTVQNWLKRNQKTFLLVELKNCETLEPVR